MSDSSSSTFFGFFDFFLDFLSTCTVNSEGALWLSKLSYRTVSLLSPWSLQSSESSWSMIVRPDLDLTRPISVWHNNAQSWHTLWQKFEGTNYRYMIVKACVPVFGVTLGILKIELRIFEDIDHRWKMVSLTTFALYRMKSLPEHHVGMSSIINHKKCAG